LIDVCSRRSKLLPDIQIGHLLSVFSPNILSLLTLGPRPCFRLFSSIASRLKTLSSKSLPTMTPAFSDEDSKLIADLHNLSKKSPKLVKSSTYPAPADPKTIVRSWKMNEFKYYDIPSPFPTLARGIFTTELSPTINAEGEAAEKEAADPKYRIVARGYDKFFNIGEVPWCTVRRISTHKRACL
jgi:hypothetical protein